VISARDNCSSAPGVATTRPRGNFSSLSIKGSARPALTQLNRLDTFVPGGRNPRLNLTVDNGVGSNLGSSMKTSLYVLMATFFSLAKTLGGPGGNRTPDALLRTEALYPLSYEAAFVTR
jgi:hypothetical protein